jgi:predicted ATP-dependent serine protease
MIRLNDIKSDFKSYGEFKLTNKTIQKLFFGNQDSGFKHGSSILIAGPAGCGKSSFCSILLNDLASRGAKVLYNSAEEPVESVKKRFQRLNIQTNNNLFVTSQRDIDEMFKDAATIDADVLVIDSLQSLGAASQWLSLLKTICEWCQRTNVIVFIVSQTNKSGGHSGSQNILNEVDAYLSFNIDKNRKRYVSMMKNRLGPTDIFFDVSTSFSNFDIVDPSSASNLRKFIEKCFVDGYSISINTFKKLNVKCTEDEWKQEVNYVILDMSASGWKFDETLSNDIKQITARK